MYGHIYPEYQLSGSSIFNGIMKDPCQLILFKGALRFQRSHL